MAEANSVITVKTILDVERARLLDCGAAIKTLMATDEVNNSPQISEAKANIMLAFRHIEDARMRCGKVLQALDGGVSVYDRKSPERP